MSMSMAMAGDVFGIGGFVACPGEQMGRKLVARAVKG